MIFSSPLISKISDCEPSRPHQIFRILREKRLYGVVGVTMGQTDTPRREESGRFRLSPGEVKSPRLRRVMGKSMDAWMPSP